MANDISNHFLFQQGNALVDFANDAFRIILMNNAYTFTRDDDATLSDVSASELANGNGYTTNGNALSGVTVTEDDVNNKLAVTWSNSSWTASGGSIGPSNGAIIYDDTTSDNTVVGFIDFGSAQTVADGGNFNVINIAFDNT